MIDVPYKKILMLQFVMRAADRERFLADYPPVHDRVEAHHITYAFKPSRDDFESFVWDFADKPGIRFQAAGYAEDDKGQAVMFKAPSLKKIPHVTVSVDSTQVGPKYSNELLANGYERVRGDTYRFDPVVVLKNGKKLRIADDQ